LAPAGDGAGAGAHAGAGAGALAAGVGGGALAVAVAVAGAFAAGGGVELAGALAGAFAGDGRGLDLAGEVTHALGGAAALALALALDGDLARVDHHVALGLDLAVGLGLDGHVDVGLALGRGVDDLDAAVEVGVEVGLDRGDEGVDERGVDLAGSDAVDLGEGEDVGLEVAIDLDGRVLKGGDGGEEPVELGVAGDRQLTRGDGAARAAEIVRSVAALGSGDADTGDEPAREQADSSEFVFTHGRLVPGCGAQ
jgi:hypothetical protein